MTAETIGPIPEELGIEEISSIDESNENRFGKHNELIKNVMEVGTVQVIGKLDEIKENIAPHRNVVELAHVRHEQINYKTESEFVVVDDENGNVIECVFKPLKGEDSRFHHENALGHDYPREVASYITSEHFKLGIVPPTVLKNIDGRIGSLQLYLPEDKYIIGEEGLFKIRDEDEDSFHNSDDIKILNVFDWIIANADRHGQNYMFTKDKEGYVDVPSDNFIAAIDNGAGFNDVYYQLKSSARHNDLPGPYQFLTRNPATKEPESIQIPDYILKKLSEGYDQKDRLTETLLSMPHLEEEEIEEMWNRVRALLDYKVFLSGYNYNHVVGK